MSRLLKGLFSRKGQDKGNATVAQDKKPQSESSSGRDVGAKVVDESFSISASLPPDSSRASDGFSPKWEHGVPQGATRTMAQTISRFIPVPSVSKIFWRRSILPLHVMAATVNLAAVLTSMVLTLTDIISVQILSKDPDANHSLHVSLFQVVAWTMLFIIPTATVLNYLAEGRLFIQRTEEPGFVIRECATGGKFIYFIQFFLVAVGPCLYSWVVSVAGLGGVHPVTVSFALAYLVTSIIFVRRCQHYFRDKPGSKEDFKKGTKLFWGLVVPFGLAIFVFVLGTSRFAFNIISAQSFYGMVQTIVIPFLLMTHTGFVSQVFVRRGYNLEKCTKFIGWFHRCLMRYFIITSLFFPYSVNGGGFIMIGLVASVVILVILWAQDTHNKKSGIHDY